MRSWSIRYGAQESAARSAYRFVGVDPEVQVVLDKLDPNDRAYLVATLRGVASLQHWGVWGAGPALHPEVTAASAAGHIIAWAYPRIAGAKPTR